MARSMNEVPCEVLEKVLHYFTRWTGVSTLQVINKAWRSRCQRAEFSSLVFVTASGSNFIVSFGEDGGFRTTFPSLPWRKHVKVDPSGSNRRVLTYLKASQDLQTTSPAWPTCLAVSPRRLFVSQYATKGVIFFKVDQAGKLYFERCATSEVLDFPEGLSVFGNFLFVATCNGIVATVHVSSATVISSVELPHIVFWNMLLERPGQLLIAAYNERESDTERSYIEPSEVDSGCVLRFYFDTDTGAVDPSYRSVVTSLNRPSGMALLGKDLFVTTFLPAAAKAYFDDDDDDDDAEGKLHRVPSLSLIQPTLLQAPSRSTTTTRRRGEPSPYRSVARFRLRAETSPGIVSRGIQSLSTPELCGRSPPTWWRHSVINGSVRQPRVYGSLPWGLAAHSCSSSAQQRRLWVSGHGNVLSLRDADTGSLLVDATTASNSLHTDSSFPGKSPCPLRFPHLAEPNFVIVL